MSKHNRIPKIKTDVDIIIPVYNGFRILSEMINYIDKAVGDLNYKIYFVDDNSPAYEENKDLYKNLRLNNPDFGGFLKHKVNEGFAKSVNDGVKMGSADFILPLNTDVFMAENSIKILHEQLKNNPDIGITSPKLLFMPNSTDPNKPAGKIQHAGIVFDITQRPYHRFVGWDADYPPANRVVDLNAITGACFMTRRNLWYKLGGLDAQYFSTYEDIDYCLRIRMSGYKIRYLPQALGFHFTNASVTETGNTFPIDRNYNLFKAKFNQYIPYDEFIYVM